MEKNSKVIDISSVIKPSSAVDNDKNRNVQAKYHSNPIFKKYMVINIRNSFGRFKVSDIFD